MIFLTESELEMRLIDSLVLWWSLKCKNSGLIVSHLEAFSEFKWKDELNGETDEKNSYFGEDNINAGVLILPSMKASRMLPFREILVSFQTSLFIYCYSSKTTEPIIFF